MYNGVDYSCCGYLMVRSKTLLIMNRLGYSCIYVCCQRLFQLHDICRQRQPVGLHDRCYSRPLGWTQSRNRSASNKRPTAHLGRTVCARGRSRGVQRGSYLLPTGTCVAVSHFLALPDTFPLSLTVYRQLHYSAER